MGGLKTVGIRELKNRLSEYLREVRGGTTLLVTDRGSVIAELREPTLHMARSTRADLLASWSAQGHVRTPDAPPTPIGPTGASLPAGTAAGILDQERGS